MIKDSRNDAKKVAFEARRQKRLLKFKSKEDVKKTKS